MEPLAGLITALATLAGLIDGDVFGSWVAWYYELFRSWYFRACWPHIRNHYTSELRAVFDAPLAAFDPARDEARRRYVFSQPLARIVSCAVDLLQSGIVIDLLLMTLIFIIAFARHFPLDHIYCGDENRFGGPAREGAKTVATEVVTIAGGQPSVFSPRASKEERIMKSVSRFLIVALSAAAITLPVNTAQAKWNGRNNAGIAVGVGLGLAAAAIIANESRHRRQRIQPLYNDGPVLSCRRLYNRCINGNDWACDKYDRRCD